MTPTTCLFAYGTLLIGTINPEINALIVDRLRPLCRGYITARLHDLGGYPGAVPSTCGSERVYGRVFAISEPAPVLRGLDWFEGYHPERPAESHFVRHRTRVFRLPSGHPLLAWTYYYNGEAYGAPVIESGDYTDHVRRG